MASQPLTRTRDYRFSSGYWVIVPLIASVVSLVPVLPLSHPDSRRLRGSTANATVCEEPPDLAVRGADLGSDPSRRHRLGGTCLAVTVKTGGGAGDGPSTCCPDSVQLALENEPRFGLLPTCRLGLGPDITLSTASSLSMPTDMDTFPRHRQRDPVAPPPGKVVGNQGNRPGNQARQDLLAP